MFRIEYDAEFVSEFREADGADTRELPFGDERATSVTANFYRTR
jgi:hypothetical protein